MTVGIILLILAAMTPEKNDEKNDEKNKRQNLFIASGVLIGIPTSYFLYTLIRFVFFTK